MASSLKEQIQQDMKAAMRAKETARLAVIRMLLAAIKQKEIDERITLDDPQTLAVIEKAIKQRRDSAQQFRQGNREDLASKEEAEVAILQTYLPQPLTESEIETIITEAIAKTGAQSMQDMGKVMAIVKPEVQGRADMGQLSAKIKAILTSE